jgi:uncharacterized Fe-S cluster-containing radical SAM superfamily protein
VDNVSELSEEDQKRTDRSFYYHDPNQVQERIRQLMKEMGVKEYKEAAFADAAR